MLFRLEESASDINHMRMSFRYNLTGIGSSARQYNMIAVSLPS
jgi:hypothetical protein